MIDPETVQRTLTGGPVDENIDLAAAIGRCSNNWAHAETHLAILFCLLSKTDLTTAVIIFGCFRATRTQSDVLKRLGRISPLMTPQKIELLDDLMKEYQTLADERNRLLHKAGAMKRSRFFFAALDCFASLAMTAGAMAPPTQDLWPHSAAPPGSGRGNALVFHPTG